MMVDITTVIDCSDISVTVTDNHSFTTGINDLVMMKYTRLHNRAFFLRLVYCLAMQHVLVHFIFAYFQNLFPLR